MFSRLFSRGPSTGIIRATTTLGNTPTDKTGTEPSDVPVVANETNHGATRADIITEAATTSGLLDRAAYLVRRSQGPGPSVVLGKHLMDLESARNLVTTWRRALATLLNISSVSAAGSLVAGPSRSLSRPDPLCLWTKDGMSEAPKRAFARCSQASRGSTPGFLTASAPCIKSLSRRGCRGLRGERRHGPRTWRTACWESLASTCLYSTGNETEHSSGFSRPSSSRQTICPSSPGTLATTGISPRILS